MIVDLTSLQVPQPTFSESLNPILPFIIIGLIIATLVAIAVLGMRFIKIKLDYDNPDGSPTHGFWQVWVKKNITMEGWLSTNETLEHFNELELVAKQAKENGIEINVKEIRNSVERKEIFIFNLKRTDDYDLLEKKGRRTRLMLTSNPLEQKNHWFLPVKGKRSLKAIVMTDRPKVMCLAYGTIKIDVQTEDKGIDDWWLGALEPDEPAKFYEFGFSKDAIQNMRYVYNITFNSGFEKLAKATSLFATLYKVVVEKENLEELTKSQERIIEDKEKEIKHVNVKYNLANYALNQKKYVDKGKTVIMGQPAFGAMLVIFSMVIGVIMYEMFPDIFPTLTNAQWVGFGIACILVYFAIRAVVKSKEKDQMKVQTEDTEAV